MLSAFPNMFVAYVFHFNVFPIYITLQNRENKTMVKSGGLGVAIACSLYLVVANFGYLAYGNELEDSVLANVASSSGAISYIAKIALTILVTCSYPLLFNEYKKNVIKFVTEIHAYRTKQEEFQLSGC
jgi:amino acid permease